MSSSPTRHWAGAAVGRMRIFDALCATAIAFSSLQILVLGYGRDQAIFAVVGRTVLEGGMPYRDAWDIKPPGIYLLYALAAWLFGSAEYAIRIVEVGFVLAGVVALLALGRRWWSSVRLGLGAAVIWTLVYAQMDYWHTAQAESFAASLTVVALALAPLAQAAWNRRSWFRWGAAGAACGALALLKPNFALAGAVLAGFIWLRKAWSHDYPRLRATIALAAGCVLPCLLVLLWLSLRGALADFVEISSSFLPRYTKLSWQGLRVLPGVYRVLTEWWIGYSSLLFVGILLLLLLPPAAGERGPVWLLCALVLVYLGGVLSQAKFFPYHFSVVWPLASLLAALGFGNLWLRVAGRGPAAKVAFLVGLALVTGMRSLSDDWGSRFLSRMRLFSDESLDIDTTDRLRSFHSYDLHDRRALATLIAKATPPGSRMLVWGFEPIFYSWAGRRPSSRFFFNIPLRSPWYQDRARATFLQELRRDLPKALVVIHSDSFSQIVTGDPDDSAASLEKFAPLAEIVATRYFRAATIGSYDLFLLRTTGESP
jgi:hypothetical protein